MTTQDKKNWLNRYKNIIIEIDSILDDLDYFREVATNISPHYGLAIRGGHKIDKLQNAVAEIVDLHSLLINTTLEALNIRKEVVKAIESLESPILWIVLTRRYILFKTWDEIADSVGYNRKHTIRLHNKALDIMSFEDKK